MTRKQPEVHIILVNWNGLADTLDCLASLEGVTYPAASLVVVDNGSAGGDAATIRESHPDVTVIETGENLGFTGGNNVGIRHALSAGADYILCLNNDTTVAPGFLEPLVQALEDDPERGIAVPHILYFDAPDKSWFFGALTSFDAAMIPHGAPAWHCFPPKCVPLPQEPFGTDIATGCALLARADVMRRLNGFDDRYFAYYEDVDLSLRARGLGFTSVVVPASQVWHKVSRASGGEMSPGIMYYLMRNTRLIARSHAPGGVRAGESFYQAYARRAIGLGMIWNSVDSRVAQARTQSLISGAICAHLGLYGRRQDHSHIERAVARCLSLVSPLQYLLRFLARVYWFLYAHVLRHLIVPRPGMEESVP